MRSSAKTRWMIALNMALGVGCGFAANRLDPFPELSYQRAGNFLGIYMRPTIADRIEAFAVWVPVAPALLIMVQGAFMRLPKPLVWYPLLGILCCAGQALTLIALWSAEGARLSVDDMRWWFGRAAPVGAIAGAIAGVLSVRVAPLVERLRSRGKKDNACRKCGYCLIGNVSGVCPECGEPCAGPQRAASTSNSPRLSSSE